MTWMKEKMREFVRGALRSARIFASEKQQELEGQETMMDERVGRMRKSRGRRAMRYNWASAVLKGNLERVRKRYKMAQSSGSDGRVLDWIGVVWRRLFRSRGAASVPPASSLPPSGVSHRPRHPRNSRIHCSHFPWQLQCLAGQAEVGPVARTVHVSRDSLLTSSGHHKRDFGKISILVIFTCKDLDSEINETLGGPLCNNVLSLRPPYVEC